MRIAGVRYAAVRLTSLVCAVFCVLVGGFPERALTPQSPAVDSGNAQVTRTADDPAPKITRAGAVPRLAATGSGGVRTAIPRAGPRSLATSADGRLQVSEPLNVRPQSPDQFARVSGNFTPDDVVIASAGSARRISGAGRIDETVPGPLFGSFLQYQRANSTTTAPPQAPAFRPTRQQTDQAETSPIPPPVPVKKTLNQSITARTTPESFGAVGDGIADDTRALQEAFRSLNGTTNGALSMQTGATYRITDTVDICDTDNVAGASTCGPLVIEGNGATIRYDASDPARYVGLRLWPTLAGPFPIASAIAVGDMSFTATNVSNAGTLSPNQWIIVGVKDRSLHPIYGDFVYIDWAQVQSVVGNVVTVKTPFRMAFPTAHMGLSFYTPALDAHDVTIRDLTLNSTVADTLGFVFVYTRNLTLANLRTNTGMGVWFTKGTDMHGCHLAWDGKTGVGGIELSGAVDLTVTNNVFEFVNGPPFYSGVLLTLGSGWFSFHGNHIVSADDIALQVKFGVHDGSITGNTIGYVTRTHIGAAVAISGVGTQRVRVASNVVAGGDSPSFGVTLSDALITTPPVTSSGNVIGNNSITNCDVPYQITPNDFLDTGSDAQPGVRPSWLMRTSSRLAMTDDVASASSAVFDGAGPGRSADDGRRDRAILLWINAIDLRAVRNAELSFGSMLSDRTLLGLVQVSVDRRTWQTITAAPNADGWTTVNVDLSPFVGRIITVRFVAVQDAAANGSPADRWDIENVVVAEVKGGGRTP